MPYFKTHFFLKFHTLIWCVVMLTSLLPPEKDKFVKATIKNGEGIIKLLQRYRIESECDKEKFLELNHLKSNDILLKDRLYTLPLLVKPYNGKNIRTSLGITDYDLAVSIQQYNDGLASKGVKKDFRTDKLLWIPWSVMYCNNQPEKPSQKEEEALTDYSLFGDKYKKVDIMDSSLKGCVYYLISGHGGPDPGANITLNKNFICEDEYAYDVTLRLARELVSHMAKVYMIVQDPKDGIRDDSYLKATQNEVVYGGKTIPLNQIERLKQRVEVVNELYLKNKNTYKKQRCIEIHIDSRGKKEQIDVFFYHYKSSSTGKNLAETLMKTFDEKYALHQKGRGYNGQVTWRNLYTVVNAAPVTCYIELGNIMHERDRQRVMVTENRQALAKWLCEGLVREK